MIHDTQGLRYYLVAGAADLEPFQVFKSKRMEWNGHGVTFYVLGTSHAVALDRAGGGVTELLSCAPVTQSDVLEDAGVYEPRPIARTIGNLDYRCQLTVVDLDDAVDLDSKFHPEHRLDHAFEPVKGIGQPMTMIGWRHDAAQLYVQTLHTYPEEGRGVKSQSFFRLRDANR